MALTASTVHFLAMLLLRQWHELLFLVRLTSGLGTKIRQEKWPAQKRFPPATILLNKYDHMHAQGMLMCFMALLLLRLVFT